MLGEWCVLDVSQGKGIACSSTGVLLDRARLRTAAICRPNKLVISGRFFRENQVLGLQKTGRNFSIGRNVMWITKAGLWLGLSSY